MLQLKAILQARGIEQVRLARHLGLSKSAVAQLVNHGLWPRRINTCGLRSRIGKFLAENDVTAAEIAVAFEDQPQVQEAAPIEKAGPPVATATPPEVPGKPETHEDTMLLRKQTLNQSARKHFGLFRDPFADDVQSRDDMFVSADIRYVREAMFQVARHGGFLAVVGESGAGKTTLVRDLEDRLVAENHPVSLVRPYVLAMEDNDVRGKTLKSTHIAEAILATVAPQEKAKRSPEARFRQLHQALKASHEAGYRHCLLIDEAHSLPIPTLKHLKRFHELEIGFTKLLSIILVGQPELKAKLSERNQDVREVVQRIEVVELAPLDGGRLDDYLRHRFERAGKAISEVVDASAVDAIRDRLTVAARGRDRAEAISLLHPLAVGNLLTAAMNFAAGLGVPMVNADVVRGV